MPATDYSPREIVQLGQDRYERDIRAKVESQNNGRILALDIETGDYEMADDSLSALDRLQTRRPDAPPYILRVGYPTVVKTATSCVWELEHRAG
jgi:hypothetical protein